MGADGGSAQTRYIFEALESIRLAKFSEEQFEYENASRLYDTAVHLFITGVQKDGNKERQDLVRKKLAKCLAKAEKCRAIVRSKSSGKNSLLNTQILEIDDDDDLLIVDKKHLGGVQNKDDDKYPDNLSTDYLPMDYLQSSSISKHFSHSDNIDWPHNLNHYQLKQVITSDIWLVARLIDKNDQNLAIMVGVPRVNKNQPVPQSSILGSSNLANQETLETIDTSRIPHYELGKALSLRIAAIMYRPNRYHITTGQKFLQEFITDIALEIRTQYTIFCIVRATKETLEYAKSVRRIVTNMRHSDCKDTTSMCQACQLRQTQRNIIRFSSSSGSSSLSGISSDDNDNKVKVKRKDSKKYKETKKFKDSKNTVKRNSNRKLSQEEVRKSLAAKLESESGLSSGSPDIKSPEKTRDAVKHENIKHENINHENMDLENMNHENSKHQASKNISIENKITNHRNVQKQNILEYQKATKFQNSALASPSSKQSTLSKRRVSTPIIVLNSNKIREKTKAYEKRSQMEIHSNSDMDSQNELSVTPTTSGICTTASSSNTTSRCASSESNASTQKPDYGETRTVREQKVPKKSVDCSSIDSNSLKGSNSLMGTNSLTSSNSLQCDEVIDLVEQAGQLVID